MTIKQFAQLKIGDRIRLRRPHPWAPANGQVIAWERLNALPGSGVKVRLRLDNGHECYLIQPRQGVLE